MLTKKGTSWKTKVKRWMNSDQCYRWVVLGLMEAENKG